MEEPTEEHVKALLMKWLSKLPDLGNKKVFADPPNEFLVGHKGEQFLTTGYVLAEYFEKLHERRDAQPRQWDYFAGGCVTKTHLLLEISGSFGRKDSCAGV